MAHKTEDFERMVEELMELWHVPGLSLAVIQGDDIYAKAYGKASLPDKPCTTDTLFDCASCSKTTTAAAIACLVDDEKYPEVQWTTPVSKLLPDDFVLQDPHYTKEVTIEDILCHRSGFPRHDQSYLGSIAKNPDDAKTITRNVRNLPLAKPLRTTWIYSNIMYTVASYIVEFVSGEKYVDFVRKRLWEPLGMSNTYHITPDVEKHNATKVRATGYRWDKEAEEYIPIPSPPQPEGQGARCIWSSAGDYAKLVRALLQQRPPLSKAAHKELITPRMVVPLKGEDKDIPFYSDALYAFGLQKETYRGRTLIGHGGDVHGFKAKFSYMPQLDWGFVIFANCERAYWLELILAHILMDDVLNVPTAQRIEWKSFFRERCDREQEKEIKEEISPNLKRPEHAEPLGVPLDNLVGTYHDPGYKDLVLEMRDGKLVANCSDRGFPFVLTFEHLTGKTFAVSMSFVNVDTKRMMKAEFRLAKDGKDLALGIPFEGECEGVLIWFSRT